MARAKGLQEPEVGGQQKRAYAGEDTKGAEQRFPALVVA
jgi:hypothetical protein